MRNKIAQIILLSLPLIMFIGGGRVFAQAQLGSDIDGEATGDQSGMRVVMDSDGSHVAIGAYLNDGTTGTLNDNRGHVRVYEYSGSSWSQVGNDIDGEAAGDESGMDVAMDSDGSHVAIGAGYNDGGPGDDAGHVRVYE